MVDMDFISAYGRTQFVTKERRNRDGLIQDFTPVNNVGQILDLIRNEDGCKLSGTIYPHFIQPEIKILYSMPSPDMFLIIASKVQGFTFNMSHIIREISFGPQGSCKREMDRLGLESKSCTQLKNFTQIEAKQEGSNTQYYRHAYNLNVRSAD